MRKCVASVQQLTTAKPQLPPEPIVGKPLKRSPAMPFPSSLSPLQPSDRRGIGEPFGEQGRARALRACQVAVVRFAHLL